MQIIILPNVNQLSDADGGYFLRGLGTRVPGSTQLSQNLSHNHQAGDIVANSGDRVLAQVSTGGNNTATTQDVTAGEINILNNYTMIPMDGGTEARPENMAILYCVATDQVITSDPNTVNVNVTNEYTSFSQVYTQSGIPTVVVPPTSNEGDIVIVEVGGVVQSTWVHDGTVWKLMHNQTTNISVSGGNRTYYPTTTALNYKWTTLTAANLTAYGFTGVGTATIAPYTSGTPYLNHSMAIVTLVAVPQASTHTAPAHYIRHEIAIEAGADNTYFLQTLGNTDRQTIVEAWLCDPVTGVPLANGRLGAVTDGTNGLAITSNTYTRSPLNELGIQDPNRQWFAWDIPVALVDANKTASGTLKIALRTGFGNGEGNLWYISGYAMAKANYAYNWTPSLATYHNINNISAISGVNGGNQPTLFGVVDGIYNCYVPENQNRTFRIVVSDITKPIYLNVIGMAREGDGYDYSMKYANYTLKNTANGDIILNRPRVDIIAPATSHITSGHRAMGWMLSPVQLTGCSKTNRFSSSLS